MAEPVWSQAGAFLFGAVSTAESLRGALHATQISWLPRWERRPSVVVTQCRTVNGGLWRTCWTEADKGLQHFTEANQCSMDWRLIALERTNVGHDVVDMLLARRIVHRIEGSKSSSPNWHVERAMGSETPTEYEQCSDVTCGEFALVPPGECRQVGWRDFHGERSRAVSFGCLSMTRCAVLKKRGLACGEVRFTRCGL